MRQLFINYDIFIIKIKIKKIKNKIFYDININIYLSNSCIYFFR